MPETAGDIWINKKPLKTLDHESILICKRLNGLFHEVFGTLHPDKVNNLANFISIKAIRQEVEGFVREIFVEVPKQFSLNVELR